MTSRAAAKSCARHIINFNDALSRRAAPRAAVPSGVSARTLTSSRGRRASEQRRAPNIFNDPAARSRSPPPPPRRPPPASPHPAARVIAPVLIAPLLAA